MRILQLSTKVPYPPKDGGAAGVYVFSEVLQKLGHAVSILAINPPKHFIDPSSLAEMPAAIDIYPVSIDTTPKWYWALNNLLFKSLPYQVERFFHKEVEAKLIELLENFKPEVIQLEGIYLCLYIPIIRKYSKAKIILRAHNVEHALWQEITASEKNPLKKFYLRLQTKRIKSFEIAQLFAVDGITTVTENDKDILQTYKSATPIRVLPFGVSTIENPISPIKQSITDIAFIGALDWMPNLEALQWFINDVWPGILKAYPLLKFHIAGRNASPSFATYITQKKNVVFHGEVPDSSAFLSQYSILVVPLLSGSGIRVKIIEAMRQGLAIIASPKAAEGIPVIHGKNILLAEHPEDFITSIGMIIENHELLAKLSTNAKILVNEKFNILAVGKELVEFYNNI